MAIEDTDIDTDGNFSTKNTSLAAYLLMEGFELLDVHLNASEHSYRTIATFIFKANDSLLECKRNFQVAKAEGNLVLYFEAYRKCLRMTKVGKL